ncbi:shikimate dehydrogenase [Carnobacterium maltaromaticum]|jgi:shikimate dehydrogenase|uniref:Shikimate dehydrogenase (NADP(+)) n=1 Tax=Carnobacterium maltaromaticum LMA28 TaxID=1234679 RepID=K8EMK9_CARML|nr:shikimate dehydrogenase [Carnobacterium maltaromaticum]AOA03673.1 shikimate dehydrogenase [Carnobacterium maltaromaticum]KRN61934.1 shikimate dehydrogenase [Carnobacterium maltaromaticum DSM 20342]MCI1819491.1 shikimate dehydrogenase [Carnobacterium maltaromaticum]CCO09726.2 shikimate 5-dehydrogenase [Carnobacterium maltaromaticum LMA28]
MSERITGHTELIGLFATPIRHSISPQMHNESFARLGLDYAYLAFEVGKEELPAAIQSIKTLGMRGANLSMPNKQLACQYMDHLSPAAKMAGAINTIVNDDGVLTGHITDGTGFMSSLEMNGISIIGKQMTILGAGGAATAILIQAVLDGVGKISVFNAKDAFFATAADKIASIKAETGCDIQLHDLADEDLLRQEIAASAILVNATGVGMKPLEGQSLITDASLLRSDLVVADVIYTPSETALLKLAKAQGCQTLNGLGMLIGQGAAAFKLWTGKEMPVAEIKELLF